VDDLVAKLEKLLADAEECDLVANLAVEQDKRTAFRALAIQHRAMAEEILTVIEQRPKA
jgi:hypothetical protein